MTLLLISVFLMALGIFLFKIRLEDASNDFIKIIVAGTITVIGIFAFISATAIKIYLLLN